MVNYTAEEYADMHLMYGKCDCNGAEAAREYGRKYPDRAHPGPQVFLDLDSRIRENEVIPQRHGGRKTRRLDVEEDVLARVEEDPTTSCRKLEKATGYSKSTVNRILLENSLHAFHYTSVQKLETGDADKRLRFCQQFLALHYQDENFLSQILWTDECLFTREGIVNPLDLHSYAVVNPHLVREKSFQTRWKVNVWGGIVGDRVLISQLPDYVNGEQYFAFISKTLPEMLDQVPIAGRPRWFQQDGAPPHSTKKVTTYLNEQFPERWFGRYGPIPWPARSPDLTPLDFFLWGYLKSQVYETEPRNVEDMVARLHAALTNVDAEMLQHVRLGVLRRIHACVAAGGGQFQQLP